MSNVEAWDRAAGRYQEEFDPTTDVVHYGPDLPTESELGLVPHGLGRGRVLELGCGAGQAAVAFARQVARTIAVDASPGQLAAARRLAEREGAKIDLHLGDLCDLAFVPADAIDLAFSAATFDYVEDLSRVLRSVHRVLKPRGAFIFTLEHPLAACVEPGGPDGATPIVTTPYGATGPVKVDRYGEAFLVFPRTAAEVVGELSRAGFRLEALVEPVPEGSLLPRAAVWKARKDGH